jgi:hypothetical protein
MENFRKRFVARVLTAALASAPVSAFALGNTSYVTPPFWKDLFLQSWGASPDLTPAELFWSSGSFFTNSTNIANAKQSASAISNSGKIPFGGAQRWENTYMESLPTSTFTNPPTWVNGADLSKPDFTAWAQWIKARPKYQDVANDGGSMPPQYRSFNGSWGHISPVVTIDPADIPAGMTGNTYGDWWAYKWGQTAGLSGAYGIMLSDFTDSHPGFSTMKHDFNPRIVSAFANSIEQPISGSTSTQASWILANQFNKWTDFWSTGYGKFYAAIAREIMRNTNHDSLVLDQSALWPSIWRMRGQDARLILQNIPSANIAFFIDTLTMSTDRSGGPMVDSTGDTGEYAAREPNARYAPNLHSDDSDFWAGVAQHWSYLSATDQRERGLKELKRLWLETEWMHIADRSGNVRRGIAFALRDYWDWGKLDPTLIQVMRAVVPTRPFGLAFYYSTGIERAREQHLAQTGGGEWDGYLSNDHQTFSNLRNTQGIATDYFVSDVGVPALGRAGYPAAWIVLERYDSAGNDLLPASERTALQAIAPILSTTSDIQIFPKPLSYSANATGVGFYDQNNHLIVTASNLLSTDQTVTVSLETLPDGQYTATDFFNPTTTIPVTVVNHQGSFAVPLTRWDTRAFSINTP